MVCFEGVAVPVFVFVAVHGLSAVLAWGAVVVVVDEAFAGLLVGVAVAALCGVLFLGDCFFMFSPFFFVVFGALGRGRTCGLRGRVPLLCPSELRALWAVL